MYPSTSTTQPGKLTRRSLLVRSLALGSSTLLVGGCSALAVPGLRSTSAPLVATPTGPRRGGLLRISQPTDVVPRAVPQTTVPANFRLYTLAFDTLVAYDSELRPQPRLASSWEWSADYRQIALHLRPDVRFHSGRPFTSAEALANLEQLRDPALASQMLNYATQMHIQTPDPATLIISYDRPRRASMDALVNARMADPESFGTNDFIGTGPFRVQEWVQGDHLTFTANPNYWQPFKPYLDQVSLLVRPDQQSSLVAFESGALDWVIGIAGQDARRLQSNKAYQVLLTGGGGNYYYVGLDTSVPALADKRVRQAFGYALNRQRIVDSVLAGLARPVSTVWPPQSLAYDAAQDQTYQFDLAKARQLLDAAGWDPDVTVPIRVASELQVTVAMAQIYQSDLVSVGVNAVVESQGGADLLSRLQKHQVGGAWIIDMGAMNQSPASFFVTNSASRVQNMSNFVSDPYASLIDQASNAKDDERLKSILHALTEIMLDEAFILPIADNQGQEAGPDVARVGVKDIAWDQNGKYAFENVWLEA
jgi:peptide/nickel transport system substrate-binding protein